MQMKDLTGIDCLGLLCGCVNGGLRSLIRSSTLLYVPIHEHIVRKYCNISKF